MSGTNLGKRSLAVSLASGGGGGGGGGGIAAAEAAAAATAEEVEVMINGVLAKAGLFSTSDKDSTITNNTKHTKSLTLTKAGWCLREGLLHIAKQDARLAERIVHHGLPSFYSCCGGAPFCRHEATQDLKDPSTCFESLCRIIVGQFVSGKAARAAWRRLLTCTVLSVQPPCSTNYKTTTVLTPAHILQRTELDGSMISHFQTAAGLTRNKAKSLHDLALHFTDGRLSEDFLQSAATQRQDTEVIRKALLRVRGIGEWSCDMFMLFTLEHSDVLPLGDLGVRKGIAQHFFESRQSSNHKLCPKKDATRIHARLDVFRPYRSLVSYYMWCVADTPIDVFTREESEKGNVTKTKHDLQQQTGPSTPSPIKRRKQPPVVTP